MDNDFLSHDFMPDFPLDTSEPDDSLVQHISDNYVVDADYYMHLSGNNTDMSVLSHQDQAAFDMIGQQTSEHNQVLMTTTAVSIQGRTYPILQRVASQEQTDHQQAQQLHQRQQVQQQQQQAFMNSNQSDFSYFPNNLFLQQDQSFVQSNQQAFIEDHFHQNPSVHAPSIQPQLLNLPSQPQQHTQPQLLQQPVEDELDDEEGFEEEASPVKIVKQKRIRKKKDPNAPSAAMSAYAFFFRETQQKVKEQNPSAKFGDVSRSVAGMWEGLGDEEKSVFKKKSEEDRARYNREMEAYKAMLSTTGDEHQTVSRPPIKSIKVVYIGGKLKTMTVPTAPMPVLAQVNDENNLVFQPSNIPPLPDATDKILRPEDVTENKCIRQGCQNFSIISTEWEDEYCSNSCAVQHCKDVFAAFVLATKNGQSVNGNSA